LNITEDFQQVNDLKAFNGKYPGVVVDNDDQKGAHRGELWVELHGVLEESTDGKKQQPMKVKAKPCFPPGFFFIPEIGDNVWVEFAAGEIDNPIWTGVWYPQDKTPSNTEKNAPTRFQKVIRTVSGHIVQLDDSKDAEKISITHKFGSNVMIDKDNIIISHQKESEIKIDGDGNITITDKGGNTTIISEEITLKGKVLLGSQNYEPLVRGNKLKTALSAIINYIDLHQHPTGMGPSGPTIKTPPGPDISQILSEKNKTE